MIRYRTRDRTRLLPPTARSMRRIDRIAGRTDDMLIIRGVNVFPSQVEELILAERRLAPHYYLEITREQHLDVLAVHVEMQFDAQPAEHDRDAVSRSLAHRLKSYVGISARVVVNPAGTIERSIGKAKRVIDKRAS